MKLRIIFSIVIGLFIQSELYGNKIRGWNILSNNINCAEKTIFSSKIYNINHLQLSHHVIHNLYEISDTTRLNQVNRLTSLAHKQGIEKVLIWDHALYGKDYYPQKFFTKGSDKLNLDDENLWSWIKNDYSKNLAKVSSIDGIVLTFIETGSRIEDQYSELYTTSSQKYTKLIKELNSVIHGQFGMDLVLRTFSYNNKELDNILSVINSFDENNIYIMIKASPHDFFNTHPPNFLIDKINKNHRVIIEFDAAHEYNGQGVVASIFPNFHFQRAKYFSKYDNVIGYSIRTDRYGDTSILDTPIEINLFAIDRGFNNLDFSYVNMINSFISNRYGEELIPKLFRIFDEADDIIMCSFYTLGLNTTRHSQLNFDYRSIYTRHVSGRWLEDPIIYIDNGPNKEYHFWKDIVNHLSPLKHKTGEGFYKIRSSPSDSISYKVLNQLEIPDVLSNNWLDPEELMNEEYLNDIISEKQYAVIKAEELLDLLNDSKKRLSKDQYEIFIGIFERTLLSARLRESIAAVYYGSRVKTKSEDLKIIIEKNKSRAQKIIKEIEDYNYSYPIGEYDWKLDAQLAKKYL
tara:strand:- start:789 stop:2510 length:1722 start_codon:yes stop_codon:yes gene_type:complete